MPEYREIFWPILFSACVAPLVLLRSDESVALGKKWFRRIEANRKVVEPDQWVWKQWLIFLFILSVSSTTSFAVSYNLSLAYLVGLEGWTAFAGGFIMGMVGVGIAGAVGGALAAAVAVPLALAVAVAVSFLPFFIGFEISFFVLALMIRVLATLLYLPQGIASLPRNFRRVVLCTSPLQEPELVPGLASQDSGFVLSHWISKFQGATNLFEKVVPLVLMPIWFLPAWLYRISIKSTVWLWWPLAYLGGEIRNRKKAGTFS